MEYCGRVSNKLPLNFTFCVGVGPRIIANSYISLPQGKERVTDECDRTNFIFSNRGNPTKVNRSPRFSSAFFFFWVRWPAFSDLFVPPYRSKASLHVGAPLPCGTLSTVTKVGIIYCGTTARLSGMSGPRQETEAYCHCHYSSG